MRLGYQKAGKAPDFVEGNSSSVEIRQKDILRALHLRIRGDIVVTGGSGAGNIHADAAYRIARNIMVDYDGENRINVVGTDLLDLEKRFENKARTQTMPTTLTAGTKPFDVTIQLPFFMPFCREEQGQRFALPTRLVDAPLLTVQWGNVGDLTYGATDYTGLAFSGVTVELYEVPMFNVPPAAPGVYVPLLLRSAVYRVSTTVAGETFELPNWTENQELRAILVSALENGSGDVDYRESSTLLTKLGLTINGEEVFEPSPASLISQRNEVVYNLTAQTTGRYVLDAAEDRDVSPHALWTIQRGLRPYVKFDATYNGANGQQILRFLTLGTAGRIGR